MTKTNAVETLPVRDKRIAESASGVRAKLQNEPGKALRTDAPATATIRDGFRCTAQGPDGQLLMTDMPPGIGGDGAFPTPGWQMRAAMASCTASVIKLYAAERGIVVDWIEVKVSSSSDTRGMLGAEGISAAMRGLRTEVRICAPECTPEQVREVVSEAFKNSPVAATMAVGDAGTLVLAVEP